ncbi:MAG: hypothetical protein ACKVS7_04210 [Gemmatimonadaceae bacterium]
MLRSVPSAARPSAIARFALVALCAPLLVSACEGATDPDATEQSIVFETPGAQILGRTPSPLVAFSTSALPVILTSETLPVCMVAGTTLTLVSAGTCRINADQAGDDTYAPAARVTVTFEVLSCPVVTEPAGILIGFDNAALSYSVSGFNGAVGATANDPTSGCNVVGSVRRTPASQFDGATFGTLPTTSNPTIARIPFTAATNTLTLRVYVPTANTLVHLKIENAANGTLNYETEVRATLANTWQTLTFTLNAPLVNGLPGQIFNLGTTFNRVSVFFEFGGVRGPTAATFYFDDLRLVL